MCYNEKSQLVRLTSSKIVKNLISVARELNLLKTEGGLDNSDQWSIYEFCFIQDKCYYLLNKVNSFDFKSAINGALLGLSPSYVLRDAGGSRLSVDKLSDKMSNMKIRDDKEVETPISNDNVP